VIRPANQTGISASLITEELALVAVSRELQSTFLAFSSPTIKMGKTPPEHADRSDPTMGQEGERYAANNLRDPLANIMCMAIASNWVKPRTGTE
jgi:hypothetical protein